MAFLLFLLVNATLFIRPGDFLPEFADAPIYLALVATCVLFAAPQVQRQISISVLKAQPVTLCVMGILISVVLSHVSHMYLSGAVTGGIQFFKIVVYYLLLVTLVNSPRRLKLLIINIVVCSSIMILICVADYWAFIDIPAIVPIVEQWGELANGDLNKMTRMTGVGIFSDPNDLSLLIVATSLLSLYLFNDRQQRALRFFWLLPIILMGIALICTHSRGGLLSAAGAGFAWFAIRYGKKPAIAVGLIGICLIPVVLGRQGNMEISGGTGQQRIQLWSEGLIAIQSPDILFGIGEGFYEDLAGLVAHNSFIHAYVELGIFGGTFFFGCFFFAGLGLYRIIRSRSPIYQHDLRRLQPYMIAVLVGWAVGLLTLSRCYIEPTYMILGCMTVYLNLVGCHLHPRRPLVVWNRSHFGRLIAGSSAALITCMLFVRLFARWS